MSILNFPKELVGTKIREKDVESAVEYFDHAYNADSVFHGQVLTYLLGASQMRILTCMRPFFRKLGRMRLIGVLEDL